MVLRNGAVPVLAHPTFVVQEPSEDVDISLKKIVAGLKEAGLVGMEVHYKDYSPHEVQSLASIAEELGLVPCGGSDYHALGNPGEPEPGSAGPPGSGATASAPARKVRS